MYMRAARGTFEPGTRDQMLPIADEVAHAFADQPGFLGVITCMSDTGEWLALSRWESAETARVSRDAVSAELFQRFAQFVTLEAPQVYEIVHEE